jgi:hypothetical protein
MTRLDTVREVVELIRYAPPKKKPPKKRHQLVFGPKNTNRFGEPPLRLIADRY